MTNRTQSGYSIPMDMLKYLFFHYPPAVISMCTTTAFGVFMLAMAVWFEFTPAPDHSMPSDYNRLLHNISRHNLCPSNTTSPSPSTNYRSITLLSFIQGTKDIITPDSTPVIRIATKTESYFVKTSNIKHGAQYSCEENVCKDYKCMKITASASLFPAYNLPNQCEFTESNHTVMLENCDTEHTKNKVLFKRNNKYAKQLTSAKVALMQARLCYVGLGVLGLNTGIFLVSIWNAKLYHGIPFCYRDIHES